MTVSIARGSAVACLILAASCMSACSGNSFGAQAEPAVRQHISVEMHRRAGMKGDQTIRIQTANFDTSDCAELGNTRSCRVSFDLIAQRAGTDDVYRDSYNGRITFSYAEGRWLVLEMED